MARAMPQFVLCNVRRLPFHWAPVVPCSPSFLVLGVACFALVGVNIFGLLRVCFILRVFVHERLAA